MADRTFETLADGGSFFEGPRWHDGRWWVSDFYRHTVSAIDPDGATEEVMTVEGQPSGLGWLPDGSMLVVSMTRPAGAAAGARRQRRRLRRHRRALRRARQRHGGRRRRPRLRGQLRLRHHGRRLAAGSQPRPHRPRRRRGRGRRATCMFPNGSVDHARRVDAGGRRDDGRPVHGVHARRGRCADRPPGVGRRSRASRPTAARSTPRAASGRQTPSPTGWSGWPRARA